MEEKNCTRVTEFILLGFTDHPDLQFVIFLLFCAIYLVTVVGNLTIALLIKMSSQLHTPMYFFLSNLSLLDVSYSSIIAPKMMVSYLLAKKVISFAECVTQFFLFSLAVNAEVYLLAVMAYDRFVAICKPLRYTILMSKKSCILWVANSYLCASVNAIAHTSALFRLSFCSSNIINHFFCDIPPLLAISSSDTHMAALVHFIFATIAIVSTILAILLSYAYIAAAILKIRSTEGRCKAFFTCASHLMAVSILYGTLIFMYICPISSLSAYQIKVMSMFYSLVIPMLNPLIYSVRNKEVKEALKKTLGWKLSLF
ncbi:olfactory receptor 1019-like [Tachyglossus aculeatus]|uniref:olfactory receptor 1019-like n=1 Tax=Tachyglossus aculeatus TaxID=9261 RepID=UPI0018F64988|nr:olfactory receptor 1019-like [Tachyglossus aculeatus]